MSERLSWIGLGVAVLFLVECSGNKSDVIDSGGGTGGSGTGGATTSDGGGAGQDGAAAAE